LSLWCIGFGRDLRRPFSPARFRTQERSPEQFDWLLAADVVLNYHADNV
jgi:hypothetical protein